jgi:hypothetical protein
MRAPGVPPAPSPTTLLCNQYGLTWSTAGMTNPRACRVCGLPTYVRFKFHRPPLYVPTHPQPYCFNCAIAQLMREAIHLVMR